MTSKASKERIEALKNKIVDVINVMAINYTKKNIWLVIRLIRDTPDTNHLYNDLTESEIMTIVDYLDEGPVLILSDGGQIREM